MNGIKIFKEINTTMYNKYIKRDISILLISDIHYSGIDDAYKLNYIYNKISTYKVDYICITGDLIDSNNIVEDSINSNFITEWIRKLGSNRKVLISLGNHDIFTRVGKDIKKYINKDFWNKLSLIPNVHILDNKTYRDENICVFGYTQSFNYYYKFKCEDKEIMIKEMNKLNIGKEISNRLNICLMHSPICLEDNDIEDKLNNYDLVLCGHMHNGMILPIIDEAFKNNTGLIAPNKKWFPKISRGTINKNNVIVISPGITKLHITVNPLLRWTNILFPIGINIINIKKDKCDVNTSYKYHR